MKTLTKKFKTAKIPDLTPEEWNKERCFGFSEEYGEQIFYANFRGRNTDDIVLSEKGGINPVMLICPVCGKHLDAIIIPGKVKTFKRNTVNGRFTGRFITIEQDADVSFRQIFSPMPCSLQCSLDSRSIIILKGTMVAYSDDPKGGIFELRHEDMIKNKQGIKIVNLPPVSYEEKEVKFPESDEEGKEFWDKVKEELEEKGLVSEEE